jgi:hypothetical protein
MPENAETPFDPFLKPARTLKAARVEPAAIMASKIAKPVKS